MEHYERSGLVHNVNECLIHMDVANMDLHQVKLSVSSWAVRRCYAVNVSCSLLSSRLFLNQKHSIPAPTPTLPQLPPSPDTQPRPHPFRAGIIIGSNAQVVMLCWTHALYDAMIYIYNRGMNDYTTPLTELGQQLQTAIRARQKVGFSFKTAQ